MLSCLSYAPLSSRPCGSPADKEAEDEVLVLSIGPSFKYVVPSFDVLAVAMRPMKIRVNVDGQDRTYDIFIRTDNSLNGHLLPAMMRVKDYALVEVCIASKDLLH